MNRDKFIVLMYGLILEADMYEEGIGTEEGDAKLFRDVALKIYGLTDNSTEDEFKAAEELQMEDIKSIVSKIRNEFIKIKDSQ